MKFTLDLPSTIRSVRISPMEALIVEFLFQYGEAHGYAIAQAIGKQPSWAYVNLQRMQGKGLISARSVVDTSKGRPIVYRKVKLLPQVKKAYARVRDDLA